MSRTEDAISLYSDGSREKCCPFRVLESITSLIESDEQQSAPTSAPWPSHPNDLRDRVWQRWRSSKYRKYKTYLMEKDGDEKSGCSLFAAEK